MWAFFTVSMVGICISVVFMIRKFAAQNVGLVIRLATAYAWLTAMMVIALVPIDCWAAYIPPASTQGIVILWNIAYWSTQAATWIVMPFYQVYAEAGDFSIKNKCWTSLKENALLYGGIGAVGIIAGLIILATVGIDQWEFLLTLAIFASNAFGLVAGLILLGYGLVEIPRNMWITSNPDTALKWCAHRCGKFAEAVMRTTNELRTVVVIIYANQRQMRGTDPLKPFMDIIANEAERDSPIKPSIVATENIDTETLQAEDLEYNFEKKGLATLRRRMFWAIAEYQGARAQYMTAMLEAFEWEDINKCRANKDYTPRLPAGKSAKPWTRQAWAYKCVARPYANKVFAVLLGITSCLLIWGEVTIPVASKDLSPFSVILHGPEMNEFIFQLLAVLPLIYMCACSYYALFKINIDFQYFKFNYNKLIVGSTTGASLMQNGSLMCRFAAPTCWNFYHIIRYAKDYCTAEAQEANKCHATVFSTIMASMADINKFFNINTYLPVILVVHCAMVALGIWEKLFNMCVSDRFRFSTDDIDDEYTEKGRLLVRKEQEATLKGAAIGEVLHSAYFDLEFPTIANFGQYGHKKRSFFGSIFGRKKPPAAAAAGMNGHSISLPVAPKPHSAAAAAAAAKWLRTASEPNLAEAGAHSADGADDRLSLLGSKAAESSSSNPALGLLSTSGQGAGAGAAGSLDGLFAGLSSKSYASGSSRQSGGLGKGSSFSSIAASWVGVTTGANTAGPASDAVGLSTASENSRLGIGLPTVAPSTWSTMSPTPLAPAASSAASLTSTRLVFGAPPATTAPASSGASFTTLFGKK